MSDTVKNIAIGVAATIFVILAIVGFSTLVGGDEHEGHEHAVERTAPAPAAPDKDEMFVSLVRSELPGLRNVPASELVEGGKMTCDTLEQVGMEFFLNHMLETDVDTHFTAVMVAASLTVYCPELKPSDWDEQEVGV